MDKAISFTIPDSAWEKTGQLGDGEPTDPGDIPESRLLAHIKVNGCSLHLEAIQVTEKPVSGREWGEQVAANDYFADDVSRYQDMQETGFQTVEIMGREYIIVATPYGA